MESVIRVTANVPYGEVLKAIEGGDHLVQAEHYAPLPEFGGREFKRMRELADRLDTQRRNLAIETSERRVKLTPPTRVGV